MGERRDGTGANTNIFGRKCEAAELHFNGTTDQKRDHREEYNGNQRILCNRRYL